MTKMVSPIQAAWVLKHKEKNMSDAFKSAQIEAKLHDSITKDAGKSKISFSEQVRRYKDLADIMKNGVN